MPTFDISINIYVLLLIIVTAALAGGFLVSWKLAKKDRQIHELEGELVQAYAELLESQKEFCELESKVRETGSPVITMKNSKVEDPPQKSGEQRESPTGSD